MRTDRVGCSGTDADRAPASIPLLMQERLVEACLMRGRPARADSTLGLRGLQAGWCSEHFQKKFENGGAEGIRTPDPKTASLVLSQLSYSPTRGITLPGGAEDCQGMVPARGVEPLRPCGHRILSPDCLPVPTRRHVPKHTPRCPGHELCGVGSLAVKTGNARLIIHPVEKTDRLTLGVAKEPDRSATRRQLHLDHAGDPNQSVDGRLNPLREWPARRDETHVETLVHVTLILRRVVAIGIHEDRAVAVDAAAKEVGEVLVGYRERSEREALFRREADA